MPPPAPCPARRSPLRSRTRISTSLRLSFRVTGHQALHEPLLVGQAADPAVQREIAQGPQPLSHCGPPRHPRGDELRRRHRRLRMTALAEIPLQAPPRPAGAEQPGGHHRLRGALPRGRGHPAGREPRRRQPRRRAVAPPRARRPAGRPRAPPSASRWRQRRATEGGWSTSRASRATSNGSTPRSARAGPGQQPARRAQPLLRARARAIGAVPEAERAPPEQQGERAPRGGLAQDQSQAPRAAAVPTGSGTRARPAPGAGRAGRRRPGESPDERHSARRGRRGSDPPRRTADAAAPGSGDRDRAGRPPRPPAGRRRRAPARWPWRSPRSRAGGDPRRAAPAPPRAGPRAPSVALAARGRHVDSRQRLAVHRAAALHRRGAEHRVDGGLLPGPPRRAAARNAGPSPSTTRSTSRGPVSRSRSRTKPPAAHTATPMASPSLPASRSSQTRVSRPASGGCSSRCATESAGRAQVAARPSTNPTIWPPCRTRIRPAPASTSRRTAISGVSGVTSGSSCQAISTARRPGSPHRTARISSAWRTATRGPRASACAPARVAAAWAAPTRKARRAARDSPVHQGRRARVDLGIDVSRLGHRASPPSRTAARGGGISGTCRGPPSRGDACRSGWSRCRRGRAWPAPSGDRRPARADGWRRSAAAYAATRRPAAPRGARSA